VRLDAVYNGVPGHFTRPKIEVNNRRDLVPSNDLPQCSSRLDEQTEALAMPHHEEAPWLEWHPGLLAWPS